MRKLPQRVDLERRKSDLGPPSTQVCTNTECRFSRNHVSRLSCPECGNTEFRTYNNERRKSRRRR